MTVESISVVVALMAMLGLHFFRGPNRQVDDIKAEFQQEVNRLRGEVSDLRREHDVLESSVNAVDKRLVGEHYTRGEIREMLTEVRGQVSALTTIVNDLKTTVALITRSNNVRRQ